MRDGNSMKYSRVFVFVLVLFFATSAALTFLNGKFSSFSGKEALWMILLFVLLLVELAILCFLYCKHIRKE